VAEVPVGEYEKRDIDAQVARILRDLGAPEPPLVLSEVRALLHLNLKYYSSTDPGLIQELSHRFTLFARKTLPDVGRHLWSALSKSKLCSFWVPDSAQILLDENVPHLKHRWIEAHEITHSIAPWHKGFLLGDNLQMVDPACHAVLEAEANYGAGRLLFLQERFSHEARDLPLSFASVKQLASRYHNSIQSTFWRMVEERNPEDPVFGVISIHPKHPSVGQHDGPDAWRYFIRSQGFRSRFGNVLPEDLYPLIERHVSHRKTGPVLAADEVLTDTAGALWEFHLESFSNGHALLTVGYLLRPHRLIVPVAAAGG
jgi:hypothetical protein